MSTNNQLIEDLEAARDIIVTHGWTQQMFVSDEGCFCAAGAIGQAVGGDALAVMDDRAKVALASLVETINGEPGNSTYNRVRVYDFNDSAKSATEVIHLFNRTIERLSA